MARFRTWLRNRLTSPNHDEENSTHERRTNTITLSASAPLTFDMVTPPHSTQDTLPLRPRLRRPSTYKPPAQRDIATIIEDDEPLDLTPPPKTLHEVTAEPEAPPPRPVPSRNFSRHFSSRFSVASAGSGDREEREGRRLSQMSATSSASEASDGRGGSRKSWGSAVSERWSVHTRGLVPLGVV